MNANKFSRKLSPFAFALTLAAATVAHAASPFSIIDLPDTQFYNINSQPNILGQQVQWILNNKNTSNISFVTQLGDFTDNGTNATYWNNGLNAINQLNGVVPYSISLGNHDEYWDPSTGAGLANCKTYVGDQTHQGGSSYLATAPNGLSFAQVISASGYSLLHLNLNYSPDTATLAWAQSIINANLGKPTIISTHDYMNVDGTRSANGNNVWNGLVNNNAQVFMVLCGHNHGESQLISTDASGKKVAQLLLDSQSDDNGGNGWMRQITFDPDNKVINISNFSPTYSGVVTSGSPNRTETFSLSASFNQSTNAISLASPPAPSAVSYSQNFDAALGTSGTILPNGWTILDIPGAAGTYNASNPIPASAVATAALNSAALVIWDSNTSVPQNFAAGGNVGAGTSSNRSLGTSPASVGARVVQLNLNNDGLSALSGCSIHYTVADFGTGATSAEDLPGYTLFYSLTGGTNASDWSQVMVPTIGNNIGATINFANPLAVGGQIYFRWVDDNLSYNDHVYTLDNVTFTGYAVPEPASIALLGMGAAVLLRRRR